MGNRGHRFAEMAELEGRYRVCRVSRQPAMRMSNNDPILCPFSADNAGDSPRRLKPPTWRTCRYQKQIRKLDAKDWDLILRVFNNWPFGGQVTDFDKTVEFDGMAASVKNVLSIITGVFPARRSFAL